MDHADNRVAVLSLVAKGRRLLVEQGERSGRIHRLLADRIGADRLDHPMQPLRGVERDLRNPAAEVPPPAQALADR